MHALRHPTARPTRRRRAGITLLEVLIAIGVLAIGLLGLLALIPLVAARFRETEVAERSAYLGRNWSEEGPARGLLQTERWVLPDGTLIFPFNNGSSPPTPPAAIRCLVGDVPEGTFPASPNFVPRSTVVIDPWMATRTDTISFLPADVSAVPQPTLPAGSAVSLQIPRLTLLGLQPSASGLTQPQRAAVADTVFATGDELSQVFPTKKSDPVKPVFVPEPGATDAATASTLAGGPAGFPAHRRLAEQRFSWAMMLSPLNTYAPGESTPRYRMSTIVYLDRQGAVGVDEAVGRTMQANGSPPTTTAEAVSGFLSGGAQGGDVVIGGLSVAIREGDWVLLSSAVRHPIPSFQSTPVQYFMPIHRWYRVVQADPDPDLTLAQTVTLLGPTWPVQEIAAVHNTASGGINVGGVFTQVTVAKDVATVIERTVTLERTPSVWTAAQ